MHRVLLIAASAAVGAIGGYFVPKLASWFRSEPCLTLAFPVSPRGKKRTTSLQASSNGPDFEGSPSEER